MSRPGSSAPGDTAALPKAWPFEEARKLIARRERLGAKDHVLFETGYGPSGLPHIGTFGEVVRTTMVRRAFEHLTGVPTKLFAFSDDMDGMRRVPDNIPDPERLQPYLGLPLTSVPDPFGTHESFGHHTNAMLRGFLDRFGFEYEFVSSTESYRAGRFDDVLLRMLRHADEVIAIIAPTLGPERRATYSPFMPVCPRTGRVLQVRILKHDADAGTVVYEDDDGSTHEVPVTGGHCKLQWKADWAMRWTALAVDYEMAGKDLIDSVRLSGQICKVLGGTPPEGFIYELFLDQEGKKISKSKGNGLTVEEWLTYGPPPSLSLFMFNQPTRAKRLYFDVIPRHVDDRLSHLQAYPKQTAEQRLENPVWHIHHGDPPHEEQVASFGLLLNLAAVCGTHDKSVLWGFISRYAPQATPATHPILDDLVGRAVTYYENFVLPHRNLRAATDVERAALEDLAQTLEALPADANAEAIQTQVYEVGKRHPFPDLRAFFRSVYEVLLGQSDGPRLGSFIALYGVPETITLVRGALARTT